MIRRKFIAGSVASISLCGSFPTSATANPLLINAARWVAQRLFTRAPTKFLTRRVVGRAAAPGGTLLGSTIAAEATTDVVNGALRKLVAEPSFDIASHIVFPPPKLDGGNIEMVVPQGADFLVRDQAGQLLEKESTVNGWFKLEIENLQQLREKFLYSYVVDFDTKALRSMGQSGNFYVTDKLIAGDSPEVFLNLLLESGRKVIIVFDDNGNPVGGSKMFYVQVV